ncbi:FabD/lysophospholipase-like protein, partial [Serendipita vermifera]
MLAKIKDGIRILSFDGGDIRSLSQLDILDNFMSRVRSDGDPPIKPCQYFHLISGTGKGGILAIFLGRLEMSIEEAKNAFIRLWGQACHYEGNDWNCDTLGSMKNFSGEESTYIERNSDCFKGTLEDILQEMGFQGNTMLLSNEKEGYAKTLVCASATTNLRGAKLFRSYSSQVSPDFEISVIDAARATCAMPGWFSPLKIGDPPMTDEYIACQGPLTNPTEQVLKEAQKDFGPHQTVACILSIGSGVSAPLTALYHNEQPVPYQLSALASSYCEIVDSEVFLRMKDSKVYYRFSVDKGLESPREFRIDGLGTMIQHTKDYLLDHRVDDQMERAVQGAKSVAGVLLGSICTSIISTKSLEWGLPSLDPSFVDRSHIMNEMEQAYFDEPYKSGEERQRVMVLSGLGGCGKTQLVTRFLRRHDERIRHVFFLTADSESRIRQDLVKKVRSLGIQVNGQNEDEEFQEALQVLQEASPGISREWVLVFDNCDNPDIKLSAFFPKCNHGFIIVTTRNRLLGALTKGLHIEVTVMEEEEAHEVLIKSAKILGPVSKDTMRDVVNIARKLEYLPIALVQAGSYIYHHKCLGSYLERLEQSPREILKGEDRGQLDDRHHSVYRTLSITYEALSQEAKKFLGILAFVHYDGFPLELVARAAKEHFSFQPAELLERTEDFAESVRILHQIFESHVTSTPVHLDELISELQQYSLVTRTRPFEVRALRMHPLVSSWARNTLSEEEGKVHREAATRLLVCAMGDDDEDLFEFISPHIDLLKPWENLHVNDCVGIINLLLHQGRLDTCILLCEWLFDQVESRDREASAIYLASLIQAKVYWRSNDKRHHKIAAEKEEIAQLCLGNYMDPRMPALVKARIQFAQGLRRNGESKEAREVLSDTWGQLGDYGDRILVLE